MNRYILLYYELKKYENYPCQYTVFFVVATKCFINFKNSKSMELQRGNRDLIKIRTLL